MMFTFKFRRDTSANWTSADPTLANGEPGVEIDTGQMKIGDGLKKWSELDYFIPIDPDAPTNLPDHINSETPHPVYDDGPSLSLLYENAKV